MQLPAKTREIATQTRILKTIKVFECLQLDFCKQPKRNMPLWTKLAKAVFFFTFLC